MFKRIWGYMKTLFRVKAEGAMNPEIEIEQAIHEARQQEKRNNNDAPVESYLFKHDSIFLLKIKNAPPGLPSAEGRWTTPSQAL